MTDDPHVLRRDDPDGVTTLTLNRPRNRNAMSTAMMEALDAAFETILAQPEIKVVVLSALGPAFCAGHDLREMRTNRTRADHEKLFALCSRLMRHIIELPKPVIARVHAMASAAGCQLVATCDLAVAGQSARFATPGVNIGLFCSTPGVALSRAVGRKAALEMLYTGDPIDAAHAERIGLVNRAVPDDQLDDAVYALARRIASKSVTPIIVGKPTFYTQIDLDLPSAYVYASEAMTRNMQLDDAAEGIDAFLEKREPVWRGS